MSRLEKAKNRICQIPSDYTYDEARYLLGQLGFAEHNKGKTSGSRVLFYRGTDGKIIMLHKPHPKNVMDKAAVAGLCSYLKGIGEL